MVERSVGEQSIDERLLEAVAEVDRPSTVCTGRDLPMVMPGLEVVGLGPVRLPLGPTQSRELIGLCRQAPYGKGAETIVDTDVRRVWELEPGRFRLSNPRWHELVNAIIGEVQEELGLEERELTAHLYRLLVYESGCFFLPHRDGEKLDRMVATLVIGLPSAHDGGELVVSHDGEEHSFVFTGAASGYELSYAAFYADCLHEVRPVRSGYRLCLVYNMTLTEEGGTEGVLAPTTGPAITRVARVLDAWSRDPDRQKLAVALDHQYTRDGLTLDALKGVDRSRAEVLLRAAERADCVVHLALVTLWQAGSAEYAGPVSAHRGDWYDDDDNDGDEYEMGELFDESLSLSHWSDRDGNTVGLGEIPLEEDEIVAAGPLDEWDPSEQNFEGYTGNAGMTLERWYHRAAAVIWPREIHFSVLCSAGTGAAIGGLQAMVRQLGQSDSSSHEALRASCRELAAAILDSWQPPRYPWASDAAAIQSERAAFPLLLGELDDPDLVRRFLGEVMTVDPHVQLDDSLAGFFARHGWSGFAAELTAVVEEGTAVSLNRNASLLRVLCLHRDTDSDRLALLRDLAERAVDFLVVVDDEAVEHSWNRPSVDRGALLADLVQAMVAVGAEQPLARLVDHALARQDRYDLTEAHLTAAFALQPWLDHRRSGPGPTVMRWLADCRSALEAIVADPPATPRDCRRPAKLPCTCGDCRELSAYLDNPHESVHRFSVNQQRRSHLRQVIDSNKCDLTYFTERRGRPYTMVCTKTTASYEAACDIHQRDSENLLRLVGLEESLG